MAAVFDSEDDLAIRAAWLHYAGGMTQSEVADRLNLPRVKTHRLIARAVQAGAVNITIEGEIGECIRLENNLRQEYGLEICEVAPDLNEEGIPLRALGIRGADFLYRLIGSQQYKLLGIGHGRTLAAAASHLRRIETSGIRFVSLIGGLARNYAANPHDVIHKLAEKTSAPAYMLPVPFAANTPEDREVLLSQRGVAGVFELSAASEVKIVGIGNVEADAQLVAADMIDRAEISSIKAMGARAEVLGYFFDTEGKHVETPLTSRSITLDLDVLRRSRLIAIAGGRDKVGAIRAVLKSGLLSGLIVDEVTARNLLSYAP